MTWRGHKRTFCSAGDVLDSSVIIRVAIKRGLYICKDPLSCIFQICTLYNMLYFNLKSGPFLHISDFF